MTNSKKKKIVDEAALALQKIAEPVTNKWRNLSATMKQVPPPSPAPEYVQYIPSMDPSDSLPFTQEDGYPEAMSEMSPSDGMKVVGLRPKLAKQQNMWSDDAPPATPFSGKLLNKMSEMKTRSPEIIDFSLEEDEEVEEFIMPTDENDLEIIRKSFVIERVGERMRIYAIVVDTQERSNNDINMIRCEGDPLGCYAYNSMHDAYLINCTTYVDLGCVSVAYRVKTQGSHDSGNLIALPDELIEKYMTPTQKKQLKAFREKYKAARYTIQFMQAIDC